ncbi:ribosome recycling factor [Sporolactobacillus terrae]|uniref:Ribosome-recycling factor n=1 Tax=Sporolactobacillus terrae TaxID=269673 RepID=A0A410D8E3_9BACL|nr:ribosome recycling factor [Sporolactobacillus terrae]QAA22370.1 ribosome recycling factor [Sporolactobacillus terrae]QAA25346.1 ribosome recycling factor [Sporolactobacillus terrae]UAK17155.1 ribosome recycling factor [Sporolactobacillus terrae]BBN98686.1 ribosome-recycling factor [Sporolactobacillus terrae]
MAQTELFKDAQERMGKAVKAFQRELVTVRAGRANPSLLNKVTVEYYGAETPLNQVASITVPEARLLLIQPYDRTALPNIEKGILKSDLGITPTNDGQVIRIAIPPLTEERRADLVKLVRKMAEEAKIAVRNVRRDANDQVKKMAKNNELTKDDVHEAEDDIQKLTNETIKAIDQLAADKEKEMMDI